MKKKTGIVLIMIISILLIGGISYNVYAKYVLSQRVSSSFDTVDYYFDVETDKTEITTLPATVNIKIKNNDGINFTDTDLKYSLEASNPNLDIQISENLGTLTGGSKQEKNFTVTLKAKSGINWLEENVNLKFNISKPYTDNKEIKLSVITKEGNSPKLCDGMIPIKFTEPTDNKMGQVIETNINDYEWYNYRQSKWANTKTKDGSMWVWIPRFAYKITYTNPNDKSQGGTIDVKFLMDTTDNYYENGKVKTAKRVSSASEIADTTKEYYVHPAFTNESKINYANGGWDKELTGIWVSKFEAGYATGNNSAPVKSSSINYTQSTAWVVATEAGTSSDSRQPARNWLDGIYGEKVTSIKYPTFQPKTYAMNYININDAYNISRILTENGNIYGLSSSTNSHLMKNSEWGAIAYLSHSKYGTNGIEPYINNINLNNSTKSVYAVTGVTSGTTNAGAKITTIKKINEITGNTANDGVYTWNQKEGQKASTTLNMYGVYDFSGGTWKRTAGYIANGNGNLKTYGANVAYDGDKLKTISTKYTTVYPCAKENNSNLDNSSIENYKTNKYIYGDGIGETFTSGTGTTSWDKNYSYFPALGDPFANRGGCYWNGGYAGLFYFSRSNGGSGHSHGFRPVLVMI